MVRRSQASCSRLRRPCPPRMPWVGLRSTAQCASHAPSPRPTPVDRAQLNTHPAPLFAAAVTVALVFRRYNNNMDVARLLIRAGADPAATNERGVAAKDMTQRWCATP